MLIVPNVNHAKSQRIGTVLGSDGCFLESRFMDSPPPSMHIFTTEFVGCWYTPDLCILADRPSFGAQLNDERTSKPCRLSSKSPRWVLQSWGFHATRVTSRQAVAILLYVYRAVDTTLR